jgi:hypothetical protein
LAAELKPFLPPEITVEVSPEIPREFGDVTADALMRTVPLEGGGSLVIDETEALTAVDVDLGGGGGQSAKGAGDSLRRRVLYELGRVLSLRGIGGQVVLDLPRSAVRAPKVLRDGLSAALKPFGLVSIPAVTKEGLVMLVIGQNRPTLLGLLTEPGGDSPRPGRRFRPEIEAWQVYDRALLADRNQPPMAIQLSPRALSVWQSVDASSALLSATGRAPKLDQSVEVPSGHRP